MNTGLRRIVARCAATTLVGVIAVSGATAAQAHTLGTQLGTATLTPASGLDTDAPTLSSAAVCPDAASNVQLVLYGQGLPSGQLNVSPNYSKAIPPLNSAGGYDIAMQDTFQALGQQQTPPVVYSGLYKLALVCTNVTGIADFGDYVASVNFSDPNHWTSSVAVATTTTLAASPAATATAGAAVTLTATVGPAGAAGSVQFLDGTTSLGSSAVSGSAATLSTTALAAGAHSLTATFTPTAPTGAQPSTSTAVAYTVTAAAPALPTITHGTAFVLPVGSAFTCPDGSKQVVSAAALDKTVSCPSGGAFIAVSVGAPPVALVTPSLAGTVKVGHKLTVTPGTWTVPYTSRTLVWRRDGKTIKHSGATYVVTKADKGHKFSVLITTHAAGHLDGQSSTAGAVKGALTSPVASMIDVHRDGIAGNSTPLSVPVGSVIGCVKADLAGATSTTSGWLLDGATYTAPAAFLVAGGLEGHTLTCRTTGTNAGGTINSDAVAHITIGTALKSYIAPHIAGTAKVGKRFTASAGKWNPVYAKATFVWLRNGKPVKGATKATYVTTAADKKHKLSVRVTVTLPGWTAASATSAAVSVG